METEYVLRIETDKYVGNFEYEMWAYISGVVGDGECGCEMAEVFRNDNIDEDIAEWFEDETGSIQDEHGAYRPVQMYGPPDFRSIEVHFNILPSNEILDFIYERACNFCNRDIIPDRFNKLPTKILKMELIKEEINIIHTNLQVR